ncbi:MAG: preprotein translocase subunit SecY [Dehalococcoidia bacterium]|nr:preprotein translocase subunit SecY [Dehalococcoidia bacterium]
MAVQSREGAEAAAARPPLLQAVVDAFRIPELRARILFTLAMLLVFRFAAHVPVPGIDHTALNNLFSGQGGFTSLLSFLDLFSGGSLRKLSVAALGVYPYITASIILQILVPILPQLKALSKEGEYGRRRLNQLTHYATVPIAALQGYGQILIFQRAGVLGANDIFGGGSAGMFTMIVAMVAGTMFLVWLGELITERGIGNGISIIIFGGIVSGLPSIVNNAFASRTNVSGLFLLCIAGLLVIALIVIFTEAQRKIPVQYGRTVFRGGTVRRAAGTSYIPLRVNSAGMIPLIFAFSLLILPAALASYFVVPGETGAVSRFAQGVVDLLGLDSIVYWVILFFLVVAFAFFYTLVTFSQMHIGENLQKQGGFIPGIRPGRPTEEYLSRVIIRITWGGALFLGFIAITPYIASKVTGIQAIQLSSTALLIVVGVALDTMRQLEAQLLMRRYQGFIR